MNLTWLMKPCDADPNGEGLHTFTVEGEPGRTRTFYRCTQCLRTAAREPEDMLPPVQRERFMRKVHAQGND